MVHEIGSIAWTAKEVELALWGGKERLSQLLVHTGLADHVDEVLDLEPAIDVRIGTAPASLVFVQSFVVVLVPDPFIAVGEMGGRCPVEKACFGEWIDSSGRAYQCVF